MHSFFRKREISTKNETKIAKTLDNAELACYTVPEAKVCAQAFGTSEVHPESDRPERDREPLRITRTERIHNDASQLLHIGRKADA